jgi:hypothetical protein
MQEYAVHRGVEYATVRDYKRRGKLVLAKVDRSNVLPLFGEPAKFEELVDFAATDAVLNESRPQAPAEQISFDGSRAMDPRTRKELALAETRELELAEKRGKLLKRDAVLAVWAEHLSRVRDRLLAIPDRICDEVANQPAAVVRQAITRELDDALRDLSDNVL